MQIVGHFWMQFNTAIACRIINNLISMSLNVNGVAASRFKKSPFISSESNALSSYLNFHYCCLISSSFSGFFKDLIAHSRLLAVEREFEGS